MVLQSDEVATAWLNDGLVRKALHAKQVEYIYPILFLLLYLLQYKLSEFLSFVFTILTTGEPYLGAMHGQYLLLSRSGKHDHVSQEPYCPWIPRSYIQVCPTTVLLISSLIMPSSEQNPCRKLLSQTSLTYIISSLSLYYHRCMF